MFPALCGDPVLGFLMTNWVKNKVQLNNWSMPFRKPSFSKKLKTWKYFKIKWNLTILQLRFCILMAKFGISIKFWSRNMYDDVCMMTFQKCHFLSRIVTKISNCVLRGPSGSRGELFYYGGQKHNFFILCKVIKLKDSKTFFFNFYQGT